jgi:hypothetical protein
VSLRTTSISLLRSAFPGKPPEQQGVVIQTGLSLHSVARIGSHDELGGQFLHFSIGPDILSVFDTVASRIAERVPIHRPQQDRLVLRLRLDDSVPETCPPRDLSV